MRSYFSRWSLCFLLLVGLVGTSALAVKVQHFDLGQMVERADKVFRGTVVDVTPGTVTGGGGEIPVMTYTLRVDESFKGQFEEIKGQRFATIRMLGKVPEIEVDGAVHHFPLKDLPELKMGSDYLLFSTPQSRVGLSTTIGLGQGLFQIRAKEGETQAVNGFNNLGLFKRAGQESAGASPYPAKGPISYSALAEEIRARADR